MSGTKHSRIGTKDQTVQRLTELVAANRTTSQERRVLGVMSRLEGVRSKTASGRRRIQKALEWFDAALRPAAESLARAAILEAAEALQVARTMEARQRWGGELRQAEARLRRALAA